MLRHAIWILGVIAALSGGRNAAATEMDFDYKDPKEISAVSLTLDSKLEPIVGYAKGISGTIRFDPASPKATTGKIAVAVSSVQFANEGYTATARGYALNEEKYPQILFNLRKVLSVMKSAPNVYKAIVLADFICHGVTTPMRVPVTASYFPGLAEERTNGKYKGDVLVIRTAFDVSRTQQGISAGIPINMVGDTIKVGVAVVGIHYADGQKKPVSSQKKAVSPTPKSGDGTRAEDNKKPETNSKTPVSPTSSLWKMEIELRDDPIHVSAEFDLNALPPKAIFTTAQGSLRAERAKLMGSTLTFHLPNNSQTGEADGEAVFDHGTMQGTIRTKTEILKFHGRRKLASDDITKAADSSAPQGPGFRDLTIESNGMKYSLTERMKFYHCPAISLARIENYEVVETGAFGVTNVETGEPVKENTLFQAGGMGSSLVNLLALRLAAQGKLDLNREVNTYLKSAKIPNNAFTQTRKITVLDLVNGTSGLSQYKFTGYRSGVNVPALTALIAGADPTEMEPLQAVSTPGTFNGAGVSGAILEQVIVDATGRPFDELMQEDILTPFGMTHSTYQSHPRPIPGQNIALGHYSTGELMLDKFHVYPETGETGLWTTAGDFARMLCEVQKMLAGKPNQILTAEQNSLLRSVVTKGWILGLIRSDGKGFLPAGYAYHGGDPYGYFANHATHLVNGSGVIVMENRIMGWGLNNEIIAAVLNQHPMPSL